MTLSAPQMHRQRRTSHEVRGLKFAEGLLLFFHYFVSHLTRGAWIEILAAPVMSLAGGCRTSHEVRGLK